MSLLNLYDFSTDNEIRELAGQAMNKLLLEWIQGMNSYGIAPVAASRTQQFYYYTRGTTGLP